MARHPLAQRQVSFRVGFSWIVCLGILALAGAYVLSPSAALESASSPAYFLRQSGVALFISALA